MAYSVRFVLLLTLLLPNGIANLSERYHAASIAAEASAQMPDISLDPANIAIVLSPGAAAGREITIKNTGSADLTYLLRLQETGEPAANSATAASAMPELRSRLLPSRPLQDRIAPELMEAFDQHPAQSQDYLVYLGAQADLSAAYQIRDWEKRGRYVYDALRSVAQQTQADLLGRLAAEGVPHRSFWISNAIAVTSNRTQMLRLAGHPMVYGVEPAGSYAVIEPEPGSLQATSLLVEWNIARIGADRAWNELGIHGSGITVANIDTGVRFTHESLVSRYRGNTGTGFSHDYNWFDPGGAQAPFDDNGHGTHTMGILLGDDAGGSWIGVAPSVRWISARGCLSSGCPDQDLIASAQWMLAPSHLDGSGADPGMRPHVVNNSWANCDSTTLDTWFKDSVAAWQAAGILPIFANGNCGAISPNTCGNVANPGLYADVIAAGATDSNDLIHWISAWGPTDDPDSVDQIKPDLSAPGVSIRSAIATSDTSYGLKTGTSMAAPHVAGVAALMMSANPSLIGQFQTVEEILEGTAAPTAYATNCGNEGSGNVPNNAYGHGRVDAFQAVLAALGEGLPWLTAMPISGTVAPGQSQNVTLQFDATDLAEGTYQATVTITSNDPDESPLEMPVTLSVVTPDFSGAPRNGSVPLTVNFADLSVGDISGWQWDFGDGVTSEIQNPTHVYTRTGLYAVSLTVSVAGGATSVSRAGYITVTNLPPSVVDDAVSTAEDTPVVIDVLANDSDADGHVLTVSAVGMPGSGTVANRVTDVTYTPSNGFYGLDAFTYTAADGYGGLATGIVTVTVVGRPRIYGVAPGRGLLSGDTVISVSGENFQEGAIVTLDGVAANDITVGSTAWISAITPPHYPAWADVTVTNPDGQSGTLLRGFLYTSDPVPVSLPNAAAREAAAIQVPIVVTDVQGLVAVDLSVAYDSAVLNATGTAAGDLAGGWSMTGNVNPAGEVHLSMASSGSPVDGSGVLAYLEFEVIGPPGAVSGLDFTKVSFNDGAIPLQVGNGSLRVKSHHSVSGSVRFWQNDSPLPGVTLDLAGPQSYSGVSDAGGMYALVDVLEDSYVLTPAKSTDANGISAYDASLALQHAAQKITLAGFAAIAGDVDRSGGINALDAHYILERAVGLRALPFPNAGLVWYFDPAGFSYPSLSSDRTGQDFTGVLLGDISGNWSAGTVQSAADAIDRANLLQIQEGPPDEQGTITTTITLLTWAVPVYSLELVLGYPTSIVVPLSVSSLPAIQDWVSRSNLLEEGVIRIAMAGTAPITGPQDLLAVRFKRSSDAQQTGLRLVSALIDERIGNQAEPTNPHGNRRSFLPIISH